MNNQGNWLLYDYHYWLSRAKRRVQKLEPHGKNYMVDSRWPNMAFDSDDYRSIIETKRQIDALTLDSDIGDWIIAQVRLECNCKAIMRNQKREKDKTRPLLYA